MEDEMREMFERIFGGMTGGKKTKRKVVRTIPMKSDLIMTHAELTKMADEMKKTAGKIKSKRDVMWGKIQEELDDYTSDMHINRLSLEIEIYEDADENGH